MKFRLFIFSTKKRKHVLNLLKIYQSFVWYGPFSLTNKNNNSKNKQTIKDKGNLRI